MPLQYFKLDLKTDFTIVNRNDNPKKKTKIFEKTYSKANSPLVFRNFLAFSLTEDFKNEFYVDNEFFLSNIKEMDYKHYKYKEKDKNGTYIYVIPYKKKTSFYLFPENKSIEHRKRYGDEK